MAHRLLRVDARPLNAIVDATNYAMFDWGQPLHAFDANTLSAKTLVVQQAHAGQKLILLDDQDITLVDDDLIISDEKKPLALAGIMGGKETAITEKTSSILVEAASFNASTIRTTAKQHKLRTEASTRFEKNIDPQNNVSGLLRFLNILSTHGILFSMPQELVSLGLDVQPLTISVEHIFIERLLGVFLDSDFIQNVLTSLACTVHQEKTARGITYHVQVPTFRSTKDILIPEDIVEEIGRFFGFDNIPKKLPALMMRPSNLTRFHRIGILKQFFSTAAAAHEVRNYALYDEEFLQRLSWEPSSIIAIKNPVSSSYYRLVTSLIPHLLKNVYTNATHKGAYNFFEVNKIWDKNAHAIVV